MLAFRIAPGEESVEAAGENIIKVLPGLKFKAKGATATFIILIALSSLIILNQADNVITPLENERELDKLRDFLINHELLDTSAQESTRFNIDAAINSIDLYLQTVEQGLNKWTLNTKLGMYNPKSQGSDLMSDTEVRQIMNEDTLKVRVESVPKIEPPYGTNVTIEKLLYFPIGVKNIDDVRRAIEDSNDGINLEFEVQKFGDQKVYRQSANLKVMSLNKELEYQESKEGQGKPESCNINQEGLVLSINFEQRRIWIGPCILLDYRNGQ
jgi:hypothetical protein